MHVPLWVWVLTVVVDRRRSSVSTWCWRIGGRTTSASARRPCGCCSTSAWRRCSRVGLFVFGGAEPGEQFVAGYVTEYSLSVDNLFVFVLLLTRFAVPDDDQHKILLIGIAISLVLRGACIAAGTAAIQRSSGSSTCSARCCIYTAVSWPSSARTHEADFHDSRTRAADARGRADDRGVRRLVGGHDGSTAGGCSRR